MKKFLPKLLGIGLILILVGGIIFLCGFAASGFKFNKLSSLSVVENTFKESADQPIDTLAIYFNTSDITVVFDDNATEISIVYQTLETKNKDAFTTITPTVESGKLTLKEAFAKRVNVFPIQPKTKTTVTIPSSREITFFTETDTGDVTFIGNSAFKSFEFHSDTGYVNAKDAVIKSLSKIFFETDTGDVRLGKIDTPSLSIETDTGDIFIDEGIVSDTTLIETETGDVTVTRSLASGKTEIETNTGDVTFKGNLKTAELTIESTTGDIETDSAVIDADSIEINASTTDVEITLAGKREDYTVTIEQSTGDSNIKNQSGGSRRLNISLSTGDVEIDFK